MTALPPRTLWPPAGECIGLSDHQREQLARATVARIGLLTGTPGTGKALTLDTQLLTPAGWIRMAQVRMGDQLVGADGAAHHVVGVYPQGEQEVFCVTFTDGASIQCSADHLWLTQTRHSRKNAQRCGHPLFRAPHARSTAEIAATLLTRDDHLNHYIPLVEPIIFNPRPTSETPLEPYLLGILLGNGCIIADSRFSTADAEIVSSVMSAIPPDHSVCPLNDIDFAIRGPVALSRHNLVTTSLRTLQLLGRKSIEKFIPDGYKFGSVATRLAVLQGLLDTDGYTDGYHVEYSTSSPRLATDVRFLIESLGGTGVTHWREEPGYTHNGEQRVGEDNARVSVKLPPAFAPFRLSRKRSRYIPKSKYLPCRAIRSVEPCGRKPVQCIAVDSPDRLFVIDHCLVTHNTYTVGSLVDALAERCGIKSLALCAPTGKASVRMTAAIRRTGVQARATTIHTLLEIDNNGHAEGSWSFKRNASNPLEQSIVIVDEASMIDTDIMASLLQACGPRTHVLFVGDPYQLPPVGHGAPLRDLIAAGVPNGHLQEIRRNAGLIVHACARVKDGGSWEVCEQYDPESGRNLRHIEAATPEEQVEILERLYDRLTASDKNRWHPLWDIQVLLATNTSGPLARRPVNKLLQGKLNPTGAPHPDHPFRGGDKVICLRNHWAMDPELPGSLKPHYVANGEIGEVLDASDSRKIIVRLSQPDRTVLVPVGKKKSDPDDNGQADDGGAGAAGCDWDLAYAITGHKCVHPDTLVETDEGLLPIRLISRHGGNIATPAGPCPYQCFVVNPSGPALKITTKNGYSITVTPDHQVEVWDGSSYSMKYASQVDPGEWMRLRLGAQCGTMAGPGKILALPPLLPGDVRSREYSTPPFLDMEAAEFLGLMVADGTVWERGFRLLKRHADVVDRFGFLCRTLFHADPHPCFVQATTGLEVSSTRLADWLISLGGLNPNEKSIPNCVLRSPVLIQNAFLRGLFEDGGVGFVDGGAKHVEWTTAYEHMARTVQVMLLRAYIPSSLALYGNTWRVSIYGEAIDTFARSIGFVSSSKTKRLAHRRYRTERGRNLPINPDLVRSLRTQVVARIGVSAYQNALYRRYISVASARLLDDLITFDPLWHHDRVWTVEETECPSMCVEVPDGHRFLQNGFPHGNSQGSEWPVIIVLIDASGGARRVCSREWLYTCLSRASQLCITVGRRGVMEQIARRPTLDRRKTFLRELILGETTR